MDKQSFRRHNILERIDRFLANYEWINHYPDALVTHLPRIHFDYCTLLLQLYYRLLPRQKIFRFETIWASHPTFSALVQQAWQAKPQLLPVITHFTKVVKKWNKSTFENIFKRKKNLARLGGIQLSVNYLTSIFLQNLEHQLLIKFKQILKLEEDFWKLKSRIYWLNDGDSNTYFFHLSTLNRR